MSAVAALIAALLAALSPAPTVKQFDNLPDCYEMVIDCAYRVDGQMVKGFIHRGKVRWVYENGAIHSEPNPYYGR